MARKVIHYLNFDLKAKELEKDRGKAFVKKAYRDIEKVLTTNGFIHDQYSGYKSQPINRKNFEDIMLLLYETLPWLLQYCNKVHHAIEDITYGPIDVKEFWNTSLIARVPQDAEESLDDRLAVANNKVSEQKLKPYNEQSFTR